MFDYIQRLLGEQGLAPHGYCLLWDPALIWTHVISDALIGLAYFSIPIVLATFLTRRRDVQFGWVVWMFATFIMACGATHFLSIWVLWHPDYGVEGLVKLVTAVVSVITAVALWFLLPKAILLPSPAQLQRANRDLSALIAERDAALDALQREVAERERTEGLLRQAQKMEAVGQLTGGIAHDFNNLLTVIIASVERARRLNPDDPRRDRSLANALSGAERAATLTDQLLAFSRRQPLVPVSIDVNDIIQGMSELLERAQREQITLQFDLGADLPRVSVDANQTENAILNLVINARDAMPSGGTVTIRTRHESSADNLPLGRVVIEVIDQGVGMAPDVEKHAFEPFFTTKPVGQGTGLGLSQVYGFAKQSNGDIAIRSSIGEGTTVSMFLPALPPEGIK